MSARSDVAANDDSRFALRAMPQRAKENSLGGRDVVSLLEVAIPHFRGVCYRTYFFGDRAMADDLLQTAVAVRIDGLCQQYEAAWQRGERPSLDEFVARADPADQDA